jgi:peroxiredoxin Q/BCP
VLYFYPEDDTGGCTVEACGFRDAYGEYTDAGAVVFGVSPDDQASHQRWTEKISLNFPLLVDSDGAISKAYGVPWTEYNQPRRVTFLIDPEGKIQRTWEKVDVRIHAAEVLEEIKSTENA